VHYATYCVSVASVCTTVLEDESRDKSAISFVNRPTDKYLLAMRLVLSSGCECVNTHRHIHACRHARASSVARVRARGRTSVRAWASGLHVIDLAPVISYHKQSALVRHRLTWLVSFIHGVRLHNNPKDVGKISSITTHLAWHFFQDPAYLHYISCCFYQYSVTAVKYVIMIYIVGFIHRELFSNNWSC